MAELGALDPMPQSLDLVSLSCMVAHLESTFCSGAPLAKLSSHEQKKDRRDVPIPLLKRGMIVKFKNLTCTYNPIVVCMARVVLFMYVWRTNIVTCVCDAGRCAGGRSLHTTMVDALEEEAHAHEQENLTVPTPR
jgi:hypothetical protein